jgi:ACT domain
MGCEVLLRLWIWVADRPGALGLVTRELGAVGADIVQVSVLSRERGRALDEITVFLPDDKRRGRLEQALRSLGSVNVEGVRAAGDVPGAFPDLDLLGRVAADPRGALGVLVDSIPRMLAADWAVAVQHGGVIAARSWDAPVEVDLPQLPARAAMVSAGAAHYASAPLADSGLTVVVCRIGDPVFHRFEVLRLARIAEVCASIAGSRLAPRTAVGRVESSAATVFP